MHDLIDVLFAALMVVLTLFSSAVLLPRAWPSQDARTRLLSLGLLAGMITLTLLEVRSVATAAHGMHAALMVLFAGLLQWATGLCEWQMPRLPAFDRFDPALRHERRLQSLVFGLVWVLLGSAGLAGAGHRPGTSLVLDLAGVTLLLAWFSKRLRSAMLRHL